MCSSDLAAGLCLILQRVILQKPICSRSMSDFAAGHFAKADLQQVYVGICSGSMYVSVSRFGSYRPRYLALQPQLLEMHVFQTTDSSVIE